MNPDDNPLYYDSIDALSTNDVEYGDNMTDVGAHNRIPDQTEYEFTDSSRPSAYEQRMRLANNQYGRHGTYVDYTPTYISQSSLGPVDNPNPKLSKEFKRLSRKYQALKKEVAEIKALLSAATL